MRSTPCAFSSRGCQKQLATLAVTEDPGAEASLQRFQLRDEALHRLFVP